MNVFIALKGTQFLLLFEKELRHSQRYAYSVGTLKNLKTRIKSNLLFCEHFHFENVPVSV